MAVKREAEARTRYLRAFRRLRRALAFLGLGRQAKRGDREGKRIWGETFWRWEAERWPGGEEGKGALMTKDWGGAKRRWSDYRAARR